MDAKLYLFDKLFQLFKLQDPEEGNFDVIFEIEGKKLYADKFRLAAISTTFQSMLSKNWNSKNEPIEIKGNTFEDFKEFLTFLYSGECNLTDKNIFAMIDIAECYNVEVLTNICDEFASKMKISNKNAFQFLELADKYFLIKLKKAVVIYIQKHIANFCVSDEFLSLDGTSIKEFIATIENDVKAEEIFEAVYKWAEHQAEIKKAASKDVKNFNMNDAIKNEMEKFLPFFQFHKMKLEFLHKFVLLKAFIFPSLKELSEILSSCIPKVTVEAIGPNNQILQGTLQYDDEAVENIKSLKNSLSTYKSVYNCFWWNSKFTIPSTPCSLKKKDEVEWYLIYFSSQRLGIRNRSEIDETNYLIAEMFCETKIIASANWKIEIA